MNVAVDSLFNRDMKRQVSWNQLKASRPKTFEQVLDLVCLKNNVGRADGIDILDEDWYIQLNTNGTVLAIEEPTGTPVVLT